MTARPATELLYDSEAALRLVDSAIEDLRLNGSAPIGMVALSHVLARGYSEIVSVLGSVRESRQILQPAAVDRIHHTHERLREVRNATEIAATDILDGIDRSVALVNDMDAKAAAGDAAAGADLRNRLRDELFALMGCLQFQDITTQQLNYASAVLVEMETRLDALAHLLDPASLGASGLSVTPQPPLPGATTFDADASTENAATRQAVADEIFGRHR